MLKKQSTLFGYNRCQTSRSSLIWALISQCQRNEPTQQTNNKRLDQLKNMPADFFEQPILNSPYEYPAQHWELDEDGQPTTQILGSRRRSELITPVPKPKSRRQSKDQREIVFDGGGGLSTEKQERRPMPIINEILGFVYGYCRRASIPLRKHI